MVENLTPDKFETMVRHRTYEEDYVWNASICACKWDKDRDMGEYLQNCKCMKSLLVICNEIEDTPDEDEAKSWKGPSPIFWKIV